MDIITFSEGLISRMKEMATPAGEQANIMRIGKTLASIREIMQELKAFTVKYKFKDTQEEIRFFKEIKPVIVSQYVYYKNVFKISLFDSFNNKDQRMENYQLVLQKFQAYAFKHQQFYEYCIAGSTFLDVNYFVRNKHQMKEVDKDEKFTTGYDKQLSKILAHELIKQFIIDSVRKLDQNKQGTAILPWTNSKVALTELVYALHASGSFNYGKADIKQIVLCIEAAFSVDLGNYASTFSDIRLRKKGKTIFLDALKDRLTQVMDDLD